MLTQIVTCIVIGLVGLTYLIGYERLVMVPSLRIGGPFWIAKHRYRWTHQRDSVFTTLWPAAEEAGARGVPMLLLPNRWALLAVLLAMNVGFVVAHRDRDVIGTGRWLLRFVDGLVITAAAVWTYNLYICFALHAAGNLSVTARRWHNDKRDRIMIWTEGPLEILLDPGAQKSQSWRVLFPRMHSERINPRHPGNW